MRSAIILVVLSAGCTQQGRIQTTGPSFCLPDDSLIAQGRAAVSYWDVAGLALDDPTTTPCGARGAVVAMWHDSWAKSDTIAVTVMGETATDLPRTYLGPSVIDWASRGWDDVITLVLAHELGHALGLQHSSDPGSVMYPTTRRWFPTTPGETDLESARQLLKGGS